MISIKSLTPFFRFLDFEVGACGPSVALLGRRMGHGFIGRVTSANTLKDALDVGSARVRGIADRVAKATMGNQDGFALPTLGPKPAIPAAGQVQGQESAVDLESEMTDLADAQLRFEAASKLLSKAYAQVRASLRDR